MAVILTAIAEEWFHITSNNVNKETVISWKQCKMYTYSTDE